LKKAKFSPLLLTGLCFFTISYFLFPMSLNAQWLETTIYMPDPFCGILYPQAFTYNETNNKIYVQEFRQEKVLVLSAGIRPIIKFIARIRIAIV
jgi:hypothetical protein